MGDTMVLSATTVNSLRMAVNYTDIHRTHHPLGFDAPDLGIKTYSYIEDYMLLNVTNAFNLGGGTESEARFQTPTYSIGDDVTMVRGNHQFGFGGSVAYWKSLSSANVRSPGVFNVQRLDDGLAADRFPDRAISSNSFRRFRTSSTWSSGTPGCTDRTRGG